MIIFSVFFIVEFLPPLECYRRFHLKVLPTLILLLKQ